MLSQLTLLIRNCFSHRCIDAIYSPSPTCAKSACELSGAAGQLSILLMWL